MPGVILMSPIETWMPVAGRGGEYEVSDLGRVRRYITGYPGADGYTHVSGGKRGAKPIVVHREVARAFLGPMPAGAVVRHLNDDKRDNARTNLAYGSRKDNAADAARNGKLDFLKQPANLTRLRAAASHGGAWWRGRRRAGQRGKAV